jgi:hypothetical protein
MQNKNRTSSCQRYTVKRIAPKFLAAESALFEEQIKTPAFKDGATHLLMQTYLQVAVDEIAQHHSIVGCRYGTKLRIQVICTRVLGLSPT